MTWTLYQVSSIMSISGTQKTFNNAIIIIIIDIYTKYFTSIISFSPHKINEFGSFIFQMRELRFRGVLFHPSGHITGMLRRWESSWSLSLRYTIPSHMMSFVLMRQAFDISTHLHDHSIYLSPSFTSNFCSNQPLCISVLLSAPSTWVNLFPLLQLLNQCCLWPQQFHLPYFLISAKPFFPSLPFYAPPMPLPDLHSFDLSSTHLISPTSWAASGNS